MEGNREQSLIEREIEFFEKLLKQTSGILSPDRDTDDPKKVEIKQSVTSNGYGKKNSIGHDDMTVEELTQLLRQNFAVVLDEINPLKLIPLMDKKMLSVQKLSSLIEEIGLRKKCALRFLLEILVHFQELVPSLWNAMKIENKYCYKTVVSKKVFTSLQVPEQKICSSCSKKAFHDLFSHCTSLPEDLLIHLLQIDIIKADQLYELHTCSENENLLLRNIFSSCNISWDNFIESMHVLSQRETSQLVAVIDKMAFVPCSSCAQAYEILNIHKRETSNSIDASILAVGDISSELSSKVAVVKLDIVGDKEDMVNTFLRNKQDINFEIKNHGKIITAWSGSFFIVLAFDNPNDANIRDEECILNIVRIIGEYEDMKKYLKENEINMEMFVSTLDDFDSTEDYLLTQKILILQNLTLFMEDVNAKDFAIPFSRQCIMKVEDFRTQFPFDDIRRKQCTKLFLEYILQLQRGQERVLQTFFEVIDESYKCLAKQIKGSYKNAQKQANLIKDTVINAEGKTDAIREPQQNDQVQNGKGQHSNPTNRSEESSNKMHTLDKEIHGGLFSLSSQVPVVNSPSVRANLTSEVLKPPCNSTHSRQKEEVTICNNVDKGQVSAHGRCSGNEKKEDIDLNNAENDKTIHKIDEQKECHAKCLEREKDGTMAKAIHYNKTLTNEKYKNDLRHVSPFQPDMQLCNNTFPINTLKINYTKNTYTYNNNSNTNNDINTKFTQIGSNNSIDIENKGSDLA